MTAYYNEFKPEAAHMLRQLIKDGLIAPGEVDERSIVDVRPEDLIGFDQCHFFAGIGGWPVGFRLAGWPDDKPVWSGSCPCQPFSNAGNGKAQSDERHLWPAWFNLIKSVKPPVLFGEQVASAIAYGWLDDVFDDLEGEGYETAAAVLPACSVGAPHKRDRLWIVAHTEGAGERRGEPHLYETHGRSERECLQQSYGSIEGEIPNSEQLRLQRGIGRSDDTEGWQFEGEGQAMLRSASQMWDNDFSTSKICTVADGILGRTPILHALGNAIVPQVAAAFIKAAQG